MVHDIMMKGFVATYFASPQGQETIHNYLTSAEGQASIKEYLTTPQGKQTARIILPLVLDAVDLSEEVKNSVQNSFVKRT